MMENNQVEKRSFFNSTKDSINILFLMSYIENKDLFIRKLQTELITRFDKTKNNISFFLNLKKAHLNNKKTKRDFIEMNKVIFDHLNLREDQRLLLTDDLIVNTDNASESLIVIYELNELTSTITFVSKVLEPLSQMSIHIRNHMTVTRYLPVIASIFGSNLDEFNKTLYSLVTKNYLEESIEKNLNTIYNEPTEIARIFIPIAVYRKSLNNIYEILKSEAMENLSQMTGFSTRETLQPDFNSDFIFIMKDKDGFYLQMGK